MKPHLCLLACSLLASVGGQPGTAAALQSAELPRRSGAREQIAGVESIYGTLTTTEGPKLRTIVTRPRDARGRLPGILFIQWLSCGTIELPEKSQDGWSRMLRRIIQESGAVVWRTEKAGVGDSEGNCVELDYNTELSHHRQALAEFTRSELVDPKRIVVFGASMGANMAPLVARGRDVRGVLTWGGGARTWFERPLGFSRRAMELGGVGPDQIAARLKRHSEYYAEYLLKKRLPSDIARNDAALGSVWKDIPGVEGDLHYGRTPRFHQQAQDQDWTGAWGAIEAPVLVLYGEFDWFEDVDAARTVVRAVNHRSKDRAALSVIPRMDHHFVQFPSPEAAFEEKGGTINEDPAVKEMIAWLRRVAAS